MTRVKNAACSCCGAGGPLQWVPVAVKADPTDRTTIALCETRCLQCEGAAWNGRYLQDAAGDDESGGRLMAFTPKTWADLPATSMPLAASSLLDPEVREAAKDQVRAAAP